MKKKFISALMAGCICISGGYGTFAETTASALTIIASVREVTVKKDTIAIGEQVQLELIWSTGAKQEVKYTSSDESVITVDNTGLVTGVGEGTAEITVAPFSNNYSITISISVDKDVRISQTYNTSELTLGMKLYKYDTLHYDDKIQGSCANIINTKGSYDLAFINEKDYVLPFDAEVVGFDGLVMYLAPDIEGLKYIDGRTLNVGDVLDTDTHMLCYDYVTNGWVYPVFLPQYYSKHIGDGEIRVKAIDHEKKRITLESVDIPATLDDCEMFFSKISYSETIYKNADVSAVVTSAEELSEYITPILTEKEAADFIEKYNEEFFSENVLFLKPVVQGSGCDIMYKISGIKKNENGFEIGYYDLYELKESYEDVMSAVMGQVIVPKELYSGETVKWSFIKSRTGDANNDGNFTVADMVTFQKWLTNPAETMPAHWKSLDFCADERLDVFDFCIMREKITTVSK